MANGAQATQTPQDPWAVISERPAPQSAGSQPSSQSSGQAGQSSDPWKVVSEAPAPGAQPETGVVAGIKRNTVGAVEGVYRALTDPATEQEKAELLQKVREQNAKGDQIPEDLATNPSRATLAYHRIIDAPADLLSKKGGDEIEAAKDLLNNHQYWKGGNLYLSGLVDKGLSAVPLIGPTVNAIAERGEKGDFSGAGTDVASAWAAEHAPAILGKTAKAAGKGLETVAPESMNTLLRANKQANYIYGKNPGKAFIDEGIKIPKDSITMGGQLENLHGQLESAGENLHTQIQDVLSEPSVASQRLDIVPTVKDTISSAKKFVSQQTGLDVPKYIQELNSLEDSILTRYDTNGNPIGKVTGTKASPAEVAEIKKSIGKNTQWNVLPTDPELKLKTYLNGVRKQIYGQLADMVEDAAPKSNIHDLNARFANVLEAQGLLQKRIAFEHGTGGYTAAARKAEFWGGLAAALFSPEPITKSLGAGAVADRVIRSVPGKMTTAKTANLAGESLQSGVGQAAAQGAGAAALGAPISAQILFKDSNGDYHRIPEDQLGKAKEVDPGLTVIPNQK